MTPPHTSDSPLLHALLGCEWGRTIGIATLGDGQHCAERAVQIVVLHDGPWERPFKLCAAHRDRVLSETTPHVEAAGSQ
jgi:hypothetical protein